MNPTTDGHRLRRGRRDDADTVVHERIKGVITRRLQKVHTRHAPNSSRRWNRSTARRSTPSSMRWSTDDYLVVDDERHRKNNALAPGHADPGDKRN